MSSSAKASDLQRATVQHFFWTMRQCLARDTKLRIWAWSGVCERRASIRVAIERLFLQALRIRVDSQGGAHVGQSDRRRRYSARVVCSVDANRKDRRGSSLPFRRNHPAVSQRLKRPAKASQPAGELSTRDARAGANAL